MDTPVVHYITDTCAKTREANTVLRMHICFQIMKYMSTYVAMSVHNYTIFTLLTNVYVIDGQWRANYFHYNPVTLFSNHQQL